ncbi:MAG: antA/AntB antirepressor family protein [Microcoleaceae cyanobacterium]
MFDIEIQENKGIKVIDSKLLHKELEVKSYHSDWLRRRIENYGFVKGEDYFISKMSKSKKMGRPTVDYLLTLDMCKELCMVENNDRGRDVRKYFIAVEKDYRKKEVIRAIGIETRKTLTDAIEESGENERMHGHGYSTFTNFVYKITGLSEDYKEYKKIVKQVGGKGDYRGTLTPDQLKRVELAESLIKPMLEMEKEYSDIKACLEPLFKVEEIV